LYQCKSFDYLGRGFYYYAPVGAFGGFGQASIEVTIDERRVRKDVGGDLAVLR